ncbi:hypothetical protein RJ640_013060 [Escallonia rubra]|uniref:SUN domain-containing protein n=1 Tax=Escallonia rubra TaxID=112253 RepID=A0AA88UAS4_9ASTE|nr:hypothetical protein RJ640_013060 [Escallonia rubra]
MDRRIKGNYTAVEDWFACENEKPLDHEEKEKVEQVKFLEETHKEEEVKQPKRLPKRKHNFAVEILWVSVIVFGLLKGCSYVEQKLVAKPPVTDPVMAEMASKLAALGSLEARLVELEESVFTIKCDLMRLDPEKERGSVDGTLEARLKMIKGRASSLYKTLSGSTSTIGEKRGVRLDPEKERGSVDGTLEARLKMIKGRASSFYKTLSGSTSTIGEKMYDTGEKMYNTMSGSTNSIAAAIRTTLLGEKTDNSDSTVEEGIGRPDYVLSSKIVRYSNPYKRENDGTIAINEDAVSMVRPGVGEIGHSFCLNGSTGFVEIKLDTRVVPQGVTLEYQHEGGDSPRPTAPKDCRVSAWLEDEKESVDRVYLLAEFTYNLDKRHIQTFALDDSRFSLGGKMVNKIRFDVLSNYGSEATCIYRLRVHGQERLD